MDGMTWMASGLIVQELAQAGSHGTGRVPSSKKTSPCALAFPEPLPASCLLLSRWPQQVPRLSPPRDGGKTEPHCGGVHLQGWEGFAASFVTCYRESQHNSWGATWPIFGVEFLSFFFFSRVYNDCQRNLLLSDRSCAKYPV